MIEYTKETLTKALLNISNMGWIENRRSGNDGGVGNTLEDLLGITENNLPLPNAAEWELKTHRKGSSSLLTLFHVEPSPRAMKIVPNLLLPKYGWKHKDAGGRYPEGEKSFRQTINSGGTGRGFKVKADYINRRVVISFDSASVDDEFADWLENLRQTIGLDELNPVPYWGFDDLAGKIRTKLLNCFYVKASVKTENNKKFWHYNEIYRCSNFSFDKFLEQLEMGNVFVDFDARTGHNHGTKFRYAECVHGIEALYDNVIKIL
ncbi:MAG: MvaI/BcnI family restriction endonuclease [Synergistaceae bacterium]|nr:MvaI/BcnI family restriction endonuclease [Synergistaceae bacterium]